MVNPFEETRRAGITSLPNNNDKWEDVTNYTAGSNVYEPRGSEYFNEVTSFNDPNSWSQSGVAPYVFNDIIRDLSANEEERDKNYAMAAGINWNTHPESYKMRDEETGRLYRGLNPYRGYTGLGGNVSLGDGNVGWDLYQNWVDDRTQAEVEGTIPFLGGDLTAGFDWNSEDDIMKWLLKFVLPFGGQ